MNQIYLNMATAMLIVGYMIHAINLALVSTKKMSVAMVLFAAAMYCLLTK